MVWFIWFVRLVWFNQINKTNQKKRNNGFLILVQIPIGDIGIDPFATHFAIGPEGDNLVIAFLTRAQILVGILPGIFRKLWKISADLPLLRDYPDRRFFFLGLQSLFC